MRRPEKAMPDGEAHILLAEGEFGVISSVDRHGQPYGVPVNYCLVDDGIYFHCALAGRKIDNFADNPKVSFCVVENNRLIPQKFTTEYDSVMVFGLISEVFSHEKQTALKALIKKYSGDFWQQGFKYIEAKSHKTRVFKISINQITGKSSKRYGQKSAG